MSAVLELPKTFRSIELAGGRGKTLVDAEDFSFLASYNWRFNGGRSVTAWVYDSSRNRKQKLINRIIMERHDHDITGLLVIHYDGDPLNNTKGNLRVVTHRQKMRWHNRGSSGKIPHYIGVTIHKDGFQAQITTENGYRYIGRFKDAETAARRRDEVASEIHGEYARLNFPIGVDQ